MSRPLVLATLFLAVHSVLNAQQPAVTPPSSQWTARRFEEVSKTAEDVLWHLQLSEIARVDKVRIATSKPVRMSNPTGQGAGNPLIIPAYVFVPRRLGTAQAPLVVFVHGGVHGDFGLENLPIVQELMEQGWVVAAADDPAEYRRRSPGNHVAQLRTPLLVHTTTNDEDVNVMEVEHLIEAF